MQDDRSIGTTMKKQWWRSSALKLAHFVHGSHARCNSLSTASPFPLPANTTQFQELSESSLGDSVVFVKIDVDENPDAAAKYQVSAMPTFLFVKGGEVVDRLMGASPARLQELIEEYK